MSQGDALLRGIEIGSLLAVEAAIAKGADVNAIAPSETCPVLHVAAAKGNLPIVKCIVDSGADVNAADPNRGIALHVAAASGSVDVVSYLISQGADVNFKERWQRYTPLHHAVRLDTIEVAEIVIASGVDVNAVNDEMHTALLFAKDRAMAEFLVAKGATVPNMVNPLLHAANMNQAVDLVAYALENGADVNLPWHGVPSLVTAVKLGHEQIVRMLLERGADVNQFDRLNSTTALHSACQLGHLELAGLILSRGADPNALCWGGRTALYAAVDHGHTTLLPLLLQNGADINARDQNGLSILVCAVNKDDLNTAQFLLDNGAVMTPSDEPQLVEKAISPAITEFLLGLGLNVDARDRLGRTALFNAARSGNIDQLLVLIAHGADVNAKDGISHTVLDVAVMNHQLHIVKALLENGGDTKSVDVLGATTVHRLVGYGSDDTALEIMKVVLDHGIEVNAANNEGLTALHMAATNIASGMVDLLIQYGADVNAVDKAGRMPLDHLMNPRNAFRFTPIYQTALSLCAGGGLITPSSAVRAPEPPAHNGGGYIDPDRLSPDWRHKIRFNVNEWIERRTLDPVVAQRRKRFDLQDAKKRKL